MTIWLVNTYDAAGERTLKLTGNLEEMNINGQYNINVYNINNYTLYTNPYMVVDPKGYTKHYYIESDRIVSKIGGGFENAPYDITEHVYNSEIPDFSHYPVKSDSMFIFMMPRHFDSVYVNDDVVMDIRFKDIGFLSFIDEPEELIFWHHKDHLGSSTQITNTGAVVFHHMEYMPSGELFSEQRDWWSTPYKFNGKELDSETNLYYYGARYYTAMENILLSVDPLSDERPNLSPYNYCQLNPVNRIDPTGMLDDEWEVLQKNDGSIKISKISNLGGKNSQIIHFSKENEKGSHVKTANTIVINNTVENIKDYQERKLLMESYNSLNWGEKQLLSFYLLFVNDVNFYSDLLGGPEGENVSASDKVTFFSTTYAFGKFIAIGGKFKMNGGGNKRPGPNKVQNKQFNQISKELNLTKSERDYLHRSIEGEDLNYQELRQFARDLFKK